MQFKSNKINILYYFKPQWFRSIKNNKLLLQEATPAVQVPLQQPFYLYDERTLIPFPKTVTILHGGYRMSIPVGVVVAPVPAGAFKTGPIFVTTLYAIPTVSPASPVPVR